MGFIALVFIVQVCSPGSGRAYVAPRLFDRLHCQTLPLSSDGTFPTTSHTLIEENRSTSSNASPAKAISVSHGRRRGRCLLIDGVVSIIDGDWPALLAGSSDEVSGRDHHL